MKVECVPIKHNNIETALKQTTEKRKKKTKNKQPPPQKTIHTDLLVFFF